MADKIAKRYPQDHRLQQKFRDLWLFHEITRLNPSETKSPVVVYRDNHAEPAARDLAMIEELGKRQSALDDV